MAAERKNMRLVNYEEIFSQKHGVDKNYTIVPFGRYPIDREGKQPAPIEWYVVQQMVNGKGENAKKCLILVSVHVLDIQPYRETLGSNLWRESTIRTWLNEVFYKNAFTEEEKAWIQPWEHMSHIQRRGDKVFLLTDAEVGYRKVPVRTTATPYAENKQGHCTDERGFCSWWLQGPYDDKFLGAHAPFMNPYGIVNDEANTQSEDLITGVNKYGANVTKGMGVRPMIIVAMSADK